MSEESLWRTSAAILPKKTMLSWSERYDLELQTDSKYTIRTVGPWANESTSDLVKMELMSVLNICYQNRRYSLYNPCNHYSRKAPKKESHALKFSGSFSLFWIVIAICQRLSRWYTSARGLLSPMQSDPASLTWSTQLCVSMWMHRGRCAQTAFPPLTSREAARASRMGLHTARAHWSEVKISQILWDNS